MLIYYQNVNRIRSKTQSLLQNSSDVFYKIIALTETNLNASVCNGELFTPSYSVIRRDRQITNTTNKKDGGGILFAIAKDIKFIEREEWSTSAEDLWVTIPTGKHKTHLCCVYLPPASNIELFKTFFYRVTDICLNNPLDNIIILGDFNVPDFTLYNQLDNINNYVFIRREDKPKCELLVNTMNLYNLLQ